MPAFNAALTIKESINSVIDQTYNEWELIIVNDASVDNTSSLINEISIKENRIVVINLEKNGGLPNARNEGIKIAKGKYIAFLDSDDVWGADKLIEQVNYHLAHPEIKISHTGFQMFDENGIIKRPFKKLVELNYKNKGVILPSIYCKNTIGVLTVMVERELITSTGGFDTNLWTMEDQDMWIRIARLGNCFGYINKNLAQYRINPNGISNKIGRYKKAYKQFIDKHKPETVELNCYNLVLANYYRYFGIVYFKNKAYRIATMYLLKSVKFEKYILDLIMTWGLFLVSSTLYLFRFWPMKR